jgi:hypothetical protein
VDWRASHRLFGFVAIVMVAAACEDPEAYYRNLPIMTGDAGAMSGAAGRAPTGAAGTGAAGTSPIAGAAGTRGPSGAAGTTGAAGTSGAAGTGAAGSSAAGTGAAGTGAAGTGAAATCAGCKVTVLYTCITDASDAAGFILEAQNKGSVAFLLGDLTLRYWFTADAGKEQELNCDVARLDCSKISSSSSQPPVKFTPVTPPRTKANTYVEIKFPPGALDVGGTTGNVQLRLHNKDYSPMNQSDDYSADCASKNNAHDSGKVTAYLKGVLVGGTEP